MAGEFIGAGLTRWTGKTTLVRRAAIVLLAATLPASAMWAQPAEEEQQPLPISIEEAVSLALDRSEEMQLGRAAVDLASAQVREAWASVLPQVNANVGYTRTLASVFNTGGFSIPDSMRFEPDPTVPIEDRIAYLEDKTPNAAIGALAGLFSDLPFGRENTYLGGLSFSQLLYSGGRVGAGLSIARHVNESAYQTLRDRAAEVELDVRTAYYQARLTQELVAISEAALDLATRFLEEERLRQRAGRASELDVLRAEVELANLRPRLTEAGNAAELAFLNLKRLVNIPLDRSIRLTTPLAAPEAEEEPLPPAAADALLAQRPALRAIREQVGIREEQVRVARGGFLPVLSLTSSYARQLFPETVFDLNQPWRTDWTIGLTVQVPLFQGFRRSAQLQASQVSLEQARLQFRQFEEASRMEYARARGERRRVAIELEARQRTVEQAERVYELTVMRYDKGLATQLDVFSVQLALQQARTNLAQALADYYIADAALDRVLGASSMPPTEAGHNASPD